MAHQSVQALLHVLGVHQLCMWGMQLWWQQVLSAFVIKVIHRMTGLKLLDIPHIGPSKFQAAWHSLSAPQELVLSSNVFLLYLAM
jgi:hypothetical protein